ncbi:MAG: hypothetical protein WBH44_07320 [Proteocatella sp.]
MAGYIFALGKKDVLNIMSKCVKSGVYSTNIPKVSRYTYAPIEGTLGDYVTMEEGDNIYFFSDRKIYGVGKLKNVGIDCKYSNYPGACSLKNFKYSDIKSKILYQNGKNKINNRWICTFVPSPFFFQKGIDIDDVLMYKSDTFKILRTFWKTSFIKIGDEENQSLREIILLRNQDYLSNSTVKNTYIFNAKTHKSILEKLDDTHFIEMKSMLENFCDEGKLKHEMAIETATLYKLSNQKNTLFGSWDYLSHQVAASPFKPIDYMDKMDIFGYRFIIGEKIISKYLVIEVKKGRADLDTIKQTSKYVDWIVKEYAYGSYDAIEAFVLAYEFTEEAILEKENICQRNYTWGSHPIESREWKNLRLIKYLFDGEDLKYTEID